MVVNWQLSRAFSSSLQCYNVLAGTELRNEKPLSTKVIAPHS